VTVGALPAIFPVNYATLEGDVVFRSAPGTKLTAATRNSIVAFEVDGSDRMGHTGWSVMVIGPAHPISDPAEVNRASALPLASWARQDDDVFVRIEGRIVSGRALTQVVDPDRKEAGGFPLEACPSCGSDAIAAVHDGDDTNFACTTCYACWHLAFGVVYQHPAATCPGCRLAELCRAAQTAVAPTGGAQRRDSSTPAATSMSRRR
jgi:hypothetical protein